MADKYTQRNFLMDVINGNYTEQVTAYAEERLAKLDEKNEKRKAETSANQLKNIQLGEDIVAFVTENGVQTTSEIARRFGVSTQKIAPITNALAKEGKLTETTKTVDKKKYKAFTFLEFFRRCKSKIKLTFSVLYDIIQLQ